MDEKKSSNSRASPGLGRGTYPWPDYHPREQDAELKALMRDRMRLLASYAAAHDCRLVFYTLTTRAWGSYAEQMQHLKERWGKFQQTRPWRRVPCAVWVFADHRRPHLHMVAAVPNEMTQRQLTSMWTGGISYVKRVTEAEGLGFYFGAQRRANAPEQGPRLRYHGYRPPPAEHVLSGEVSKKDSLHPSLEPFNPSPLPPPIEGLQPLPAEALEGSSWSPLCAPQKAPLGNLAGEGAPGVLQLTAKRSGAGDTSGSERAQPGVTQAAMELAGEFNSNGAPFGSEPDPASMYIPPFRPPVARKRRTRRTPRSIEPRFTMDDLKGRPEPQENFSSMTFFEPRFAPKAQAALSADPKRTEEDEFEEKKKKK